ncbi:hypothetical protein [Leptolinea tardivitalis]|uniref:Uncharacterized protein n=1 Tax=Leptolinea tardivitalis TaxID=229920 RepID=A0A0P6WNQ5_9CHLR|nr:hypothetical protein [Leptolinea tardivitalis]KPL71688.1 hypothetical protein ADM99_09480 [Leptolinea tardivitalis]GAP20032.1 hypothetical protein LTAR_00217 [Leptolinea tardivitalis]
MTIPPVTADIWKELILRKKVFEFDYLALQMLLGKLATDVQKDPSPAKIEQSVSRLYELMILNQNNPAARRDLQKLNA